MLRTIAVGRSPRGPVAQFADGNFTTAVTHAAARTVVLVEPGKSAVPVASLIAASLGERRTAA
ncbi:hypothetical protein ACXC9Q_17275 [Kribbella sp. CWNU-51]